MFSPVIKLPAAQKMMNRSFLYQLPSPYILHFDGCSKGNPGPGGAGAVLYKNNQEIWSEGKFVGPQVTNNFAEYSGLLLGLEYISKEKKDIQTLLVRGDSQLVIKQMRGEYKVNSVNLIELHRQAKHYANTILDIDFEHVGRDLNVRADALSNEGLLQQSSH